MTFFKYLFSKVNFYFSKIFLFWNIIVLIVLLCITSLVEFSEYSRRLVKSEGVLLGDVISLIVLKLPQHTQAILPFVLFIAAILTFYRLNRTNEITIIRNLGVAIRHIIAGLSLVVIGLFLILITVINPISSLSIQKHAERESRVFLCRNTPMSVLDNGVWLRENQESRQSIVHIEFIDLKTHSFSHITFYNFSEQPLQDRLFATNATIENGEWILKGVTVFTLGQMPYTIPSYSFKTPLTFQKIIDSNLPPDFISFWQLPGYMKLLEKSGLSSVKYALMWHSIWGNLGIFFSMIYLAGAFSLRPIRGQKIPVLISMAIFSGLVFYFLHNVVLALGLSEKIPVLIAAWCPAIMVLLVSNTLILHLEEG